ncbi:MAG: adenylate/guanylate cyclase domain-containing protein, partial [Candidatus Riflebacteria bacterium]|nr:adenylate/guanylate cyclase domain-containing protein [Candidatus Riflebacteria bacterium]
MLLAEKSMLMALKNENGWYFSEDFPEKEKAIFNNSLTDEYLKEKGFYVEHDIKIADEKYTLVAISKDLYSSYYSFSSRITILFIFSIIISGISFWIFENYKLFVSNSIASRLRKDIFLSAILPILTVAFVSYLYVKGDFNVNKSELLFNLNNLMNEVENREYYYNPYYENIFKNLPKEEKVNNLLNLIINSESEDREKKCNELSQYLRKRIIGHEGKNNYCKANSYYLVKEIIIIGKDGWTVSASDNENENSLSFGNFISKTIKMVYFENANKSNTETVENALIADKLIETVTANYGNELSIKFLNFPNNLVAITNSFNSTAFYLGTFPNYVNPDYIIIALVLQENEFKSKICNLKNDIVPYKQHLASGSVGSELYAFYAPHIFVGNFFFYNDNDDTKIKKINREELRTLKELGIVSSWINSSYLPVSKKVDIDGIHYLEAKQGNIIKDNIFVALGSEYPILHKFYDNLKNFGYTIIYFIIMIFFIAQSIISDLLNPIRKLIDGVSAASKGNYKFRTDFTRKDELGTLCFSFDKMMKGLEEKQLMNRMVSRTALDVTSNLSDIQSKKVDVALLYVSVPGFDIIMKQTKPSELFSKLRSQIAAISEIVINNGGDIDKIMGEKLLIAFRSDSKTPEEIAVEASNVASLIETCPKLEYKVSVGVNYGTVISGYLGVGEKQDFTIIGDPVNVAARIAVFAEKLDNNKCL